MSAANHNRTTRYPDHEKASVAGTIATFIAENGRAPRAVDIAFCLKRSTAWTGRITAEMIDDGMIVHGYALMPKPSRGTS